MESSNILVNFALLSIDLKNIVLFLLNSLV